jgi:hypothetical protein
MALFGTQSLRVLIIGSAIIELKGFVELALSKALSVRLHRLGAARVEGEG